MHKKEQLITDVVYLSMMVNYKTKYCVFTEFSGHVDWLEFSICESKENHKNAIVVGCIRLKKDDAIEMLQEVKAKLIEILEDGEVDTSNMKYTIEEL